MKKKYKSQRFKRRNQRNARRSHKRMLTSKLKKKLKRRAQEGKSKQEIREEKARAKYTTISAPSKFSLIKYPQQAIGFINKLERQCEARNKVFVDLLKVEELDYSAISVLVSVMFTFKSRNIEFNGSFPQRTDLKILLMQSDFFKYLNRPIGDKLEYRLGKPNQIFTRANREVNPELGLIVMEEASMTIWGEKRVCKGLQRVLLELMHNTNNHADKVGKGVKHWWLSVNHNKEAKTVSFVFIDYGIGIFESLKTKPRDNKWYGVFKVIAEKYKSRSNNETLRHLLDGDLHLTVTGQHFRGKGLPGVKEVMDRNQISNLHIISNDVFANVAENNYFSLNEDFSGTFAYWELNESNVNIEWKL